MICKIYTKGKQGERGSNVPISFYGVISQHWQNSHTGRLVTAYGDNAKFYESGKFIGQHYVHKLFT